MFSGRGVWFMKFTNLRSPICLATFRSLVTVTGYGPNHHTKVGPYSSVQEEYILWS